MDDDRQGPPGQETAESDQPVVSVRMVGFDQVPAQFATGMHVTTELGAVQLVFSQFLQPVVLSEADFAVYAAQGYVPSQVIARVIVTPPVLEDIIRVLQQQLARYRDRVAELEGASPEGTGSTNDN